MRPAPMIAVRIEFVRTSNLSRSRLTRSCFASPMKRASLAEIPNCADCLVQSLVLKFCAGPLGPFAASKVPSRRLPRKMLIG